MACLSLYTHRVAISNSRLLALDERGVTFKWKDYRVKADAKDQIRHKTMTLAPEEFMRRFLLQVLPGGFHRIRHCGLLANCAGKTSLALVRGLLHVSVQAAPASTDGRAGELLNVTPAAFVCRHCGHTMIILRTFLRGASIRAPPLPAVHAVPPRLLCPRLALPPPGCPPSD